MTTATHTDTLLDALRRNLDLLSELSIRYDVETLPERESDPPTVSSPRTSAGSSDPRCPSSHRSRSASCSSTERTTSSASERSTRGIVLGNCEARRGLPPRRHRGRPARDCSSQSPQRQDPTPSPEDIAVTQDLVDAAKLLRIDLLDHIVIGGPDDFVSLRDRGHIPA